MGPGGVTLRPWQNMPEVLAGSYALPPSRLPGSTPFWGETDKYCGLRPEKRHTVDRHVPRPKPTSLVDPYMRGLTGAGGRVTAAVAAVTVP